MHNHYAKVFSGQSHAFEGTIISVEIDITHGLHSFTIVGLPNKAIEEARDRVSSALKNSGFTSPKQENKKVVVSLAPAELKKKGSCYDCAIAIGYLLALGKISSHASNKLFVGELSLDGRVQPVSEIISILRSAHQSGITECFIPVANVAVGQLIAGVTLYPVRHLSDVLNHFALEPNNQKLITPIPGIDTTSWSEVTTSSQVSTLFSSIVGHNHAKRALQIAAAGGHNILLIGAPGTGKTLLAKSFRELLPQLSYEAALEVTTIHGSITKNPTSSLIVTPPFRSPHHTSSASSIIGGGNNGNPGEISLAHHGILFLDEFPEFDRRVIESLRQPLEEGSITIARSQGVITLPAKTILVAAMNPCPCGYFGSSHTTCICTPAAVERYRRKISGPILDRIDLWVPVEPISPETLHLQSSEMLFTESDLQKRTTAIMQARTRQAIRNTISNNLNAHLTPKETSQLLLADNARKLLIHTAHHFHLSPRAQHRLLKVSQTIADLAQSLVIEKEHLLEALQYRNLENG